MRLFKEIDNMIIDKISEEFPVLTEEEKERIFAMSERKYNMDNSDKNDASFDEETEVRGVEQYKRPVLSRFASIAAAAAIIIAGTSAGKVFLRNKNNPDTCDTLPNADFKTEKTTANKDRILTDEYENITCELTGKFAELENKYYFHAVEVDTHDIVTFNLYNSDSQNKNTEERIFYRVVDPDFQSGSDLLNGFRGIFTDELYNKLNSVNSGDGYETLILGQQHIYLYESANSDTDLSGCKNNSDIDIAEYNYHPMEFITYNGGFYVSKYYNEMPRNNSTYPVITEKNDDSFSATIFANFCPFTSNKKSSVGTKLKFDFVNENGEWKISDINVGRNMESAAAYAVKDYFINECKDYNISDLSISKGKDNDLLEDINILSNDDDNSCKVYCIIKDKDGKDYLEFRGTVIFSYDGFTNEKTMRDRSGFSITNVSIKQINK